MNYWRSLLGPLTPEEKREVHEELTARTETKQQKIQERIDKALGSNDWRNGGGPGSFNDTVGKARVC